MEVGESHTEEPAWGLVSLEGQYRSLSPQSECQLQEITLPKVKYCVDVLEFFMLKADMYLFQSEIGPALWDVIPL